MTPSHSLISCFSVEFLLMAPKLSFVKMFVLLDVYYSSMKMRFSQEVHSPAVSSYTDLISLTSNVRAASRQPGVIFVLKEALTFILQFPFYFVILKVIISFYLLKLGSINKDKYMFAL